MSPFRMTGSRLRFDLRLVVGLLLVVASVAGVGWSLAQADRTETVYVAASGIPAGDTVDASALATVQVRVDDADAHYLTPRSLAQSMIAERFLIPGELIPLSALGSDRLVGLSSIVVQPAVPLAASVSPGARVAIWAAPHDSGGPPRLIVADVEVRDIQSASSFLEQGESSRIEVLVPDADIPLVLAAVSDKDAIAVVAAAVRT